jgi:hypothetical protein
MERKNDKTIFLLIAAGLGLYWFMRNKSTQPATTAVIAPSMPQTAPVLPINQDIISTQPIYDQPVYNQPVYQDIVSTQPVYEQPIYEAPIMAEVISTQPVYEQPIYQAPITEEIANTEYTYNQYVNQQPNYNAPINEMLNSVLNFGGNMAEDKYK